MNTTDLPIPSPCTADWTTMTLADRGRFCGQCSKVVRELAQLSEREARRLLASPPTEGLCVRYVHDARGEIIFRRDDLVPAARLGRKMATAALAMALPFAAAACTTMSSKPMMGSPPPNATVAPAMMGAPMPLPQVAVDAGSAAIEKTE